MSQTQPIFINFKGGIVSPGFLKEVLSIARKARVSHARFGLRQQLVMEMPLPCLKEFTKECAEKNIVFYTEGDRSPNIMSSFAAVNIFTQESWISEGVYKDVFDLFQYEPRLKINISDSRQNLTPFFTGHINWLSSSQAHFWHLYLRMPGSSQVYCLPEMIYTNDLAAISQAIEKFICDEKLSNAEQHPIISDLLNMLREQIRFISKPGTMPLPASDFHLPYYEGFNTEGDAYWLGIYRRDELFRTNFLEDVCNICLQTRIGELYTTPWKSIIVKGIQKEHRVLWDQVLGAYRINVRHAANELNWQVDDLNEDGLILKRHVIRHFDKEDVRTYGLCFAVNTSPGSDLFGNIEIRRHPARNPGSLKSFDRFDILYKKDFDPNSHKKILHRKGVTKDQIGPYLVSLCKQFYEQGKIDKEFHEMKIPMELPAEENPSVMVYQCPDCLSVFDVAGHSTRGNHPPYLACSLCDAPASRFVLVAEKNLVQIH